MIATPPFTSTSISRRVSPSVSGRPGTEPSKAGCCVNVGSLYRLRRSFAAYDRGSEWINDCVIDHFRVENDRPLGQLQMPAVGQGQPIVGGSAPEDLRGLGDQGVNDQQILPDLQLAAGSADQPQARIEAPAVSRGIDLG